MKNIKMWVSDYDQKFYLNDQDLQKNIEMIDKFRKEGNIFVVATGRSYLDFKDKVKLYKFDYDYVILNHGATILDNEDNVLSNFSIDDKVINDIKIDLELENSIKYFCCSKLESRIDFDYESLTKIYSKYKSKQEAMNINKKINKKYSKYINSYYVSTNAVEIISNETDKSKAIKLLLNKLNVSKENVYTIGDGYSDIQMIKDFNGYAMEKSVDKLKMISIKEYKSVSELIKEII